MIPWSVEGLRQARSDWRGYARLLLAILGVQIVYWLLVSPLFEPPALPENLFKVHSLESARITSPDRAAVDAASFEPGAFVWTGCCEPAYYVVRMKVQVDQPLPFGAGVNPAVQADNVQVYVNSHLVVTTGRMELGKQSVELMRRVWFVPPNVWVQGENTLEFVTVRGTQPYTDVAPVRVGPWPVMEEAYASREFLFNEYGWISLSIAALNGLAGLVLFFRGGRQPAYLWLALLGGVWALRLYLPFWSDFPFVNATRTFVWMGAEIVVAMAWASFANEWGNRPIRVFRYLLPALTVIMLVVCGWMLVFLDAPDGFDRMSQVLFWSSLIFSGMAVLLFLRHAILMGTRNVIETALFILLALLLGIGALRAAAITSYFSGVGYGAPLVFVALAVAFISRNIHLFRSMSEFNALLSTQLAARERELADGFAERQEVERQRALLDERKRIMRDMHDGIGGRLMSLAAQLRGRDAADMPPRENLADDLLAALDELRLIVDSLDTAGDDLGMALGAFRARMEPRLRAAGVVLEWYIEDAAAERSLSATAILDIYRIVQEACSNMLRHSRGDRLQIALRARPDAVELVITDNGRGMNAARDGEGGQGLNNIRERARRLGAQLDFMDASPGLAISLTIPDQPSTLSTPA